MSGASRFVSFIDRTRVHSALAVAFLISLAWVIALTLLLWVAPTGSVNPAAHPPASSLTQPSPQPGR
jgi:hypothetical protein